MPPKKNLQQSSNKLGAVGATTSQKLLVGAKSPRAQAFPSNTPGAGSSLSPSGAGKSTKKSTKSGKTPNKTNVVGPGRNIVQEPEPKVFKEPGNRSRQGSETKIGEEVILSPTPSLIKKKKKNKPEDTTSVKSGASSISQATKASSKKTKKSPPTSFEKPQPIGSFKQKLIRKLLRFNKPVPVHDVENPQGGGDQAVPICNKKSLIISLIVAVSLILIIVIVAIFAGSQGGGQGHEPGNDNNPTAMTISMTTSMTTSVTTSITSTSPTGIPKCNPLQFPGVLDSTKLGDYCKSCFHYPRASCISHCCDTYYARGSNDSDVCETICKT